VVLNKLERWRFILLSLGGGLFFCCGWGNEDGEFLTEDLMGLRRILGKKKD